ncbi:MAG: DUF4428 domain-containing protein [Mogibacterium sp.]|nr:DUF4428 domain-containing protein [Mogibacterium sp.]
MGLFDKKSCAICGKEIGLLGAVKLEDGTICKSCSGKLSPFFTGRKKTSVKEIEQQLAYREKNMVHLRTFNPDVIIGDETKVYIESGSGKFVISKASNWRDQNPDLITRDMVDTCDIEVREHKEELYDKAEDGSKVSFDPPKYSYTYEFVPHIGVESPYFEEIKFELSDSNNRPEGKDSDAYKRMALLGRKLQAALIPSKYSFTEGEEDVLFSVDTAATPADTWKCECGHINTEGKFCAKCGKARPVRWFCPDCGKENHGQFCVACGRKKPE